MKFLAVLLLSASPVFAEDFCDLVAIRATNLIDARFNDPTFDLRSALDAAEVEPMFEEMTMMAWNMRKPQDLAAEFRLIDGFRDYWFGECVRRFG